MYLNLYVLNPSPEGAGGRGKAAPRASGAGPSRGVPFRGGDAVPKIIKGRGSYREQ
jgi:hypothetical protein